MNYTVRKKIRHQVLNGLTFFLVAVNLIPIAWMAWCGFKDNNEILAGMVWPGRRTSDVIFLSPVAGGYLSGATDGGITVFDGDDLSVRKHARLGTFATSYHLAEPSEGGGLWVLSSNKGLLEVDPATLEVRAEYGPALMEKAYGKAWKTLWVNDVRGSSLAASGGILYLSYDFKDYPGLTAFSLKDRTFRKVDAFVPKDMGSIRFLTSMRPPEAGGRRADGDPVESPGGQSAVRGGGYSPTPDSLAVLTRQGVFFLRLPDETLGKVIWSGGALPEAPDRLRPAGAGLALVSLGERACLYDPSVDSVRAWVPSEASGASKVSALACGRDRLWLGNSQVALAVSKTGLVAEGRRTPGDSLLPSAALAQIYRPAARTAAAGATGPWPAGVQPAPGASPSTASSAHDAPAGSDLGGSKVSAILPLEDGRVLLGGSKGSVSLLEAGGDTRMAGMAPPAALNLQWRNYVDLWRNVDFGLYLKNSLIICVSVMLISVVMAALGGYALARFRFPGKNMFGYSILATQMIPGIMLLLPVYLMFVNFTQATGIILKGTYGGLILTYAAYFVPFSIWILRGFFASIPKELEEAALIDGCGPFRAFFRIIIPSAMPGIVATGVYVFLAAWDELMFAWVLTNESTYTIPVGIRLFVGNFQNRYDLMMAAATVSTLPVMVIFFLLQRQIVSGLTAGAVKD